MIGALIGDFVGSLYEFDNVDRDFDKNIQSIIFDKCMFYGIIKEGLK